jgi:hypothetical protein
MKLINVPQLQNNPSNDDITAVVQLDKITLTQKTPFYFPDRALTSLCHSLPEQDFCKILLLNKKYYNKVSKMEALWTITSYHSSLSKSGYTGFVN